MEISQNTLEKYQSWSKTRSLANWCLAGAFISFVLTPITQSWIAGVVTFAWLIALILLLDVPYEVTKLQEDVLSYVREAGGAKDYETIHGLLNKSLSLIVQGQGTARYNGYRITLTEGLLEITYGY